MEQKEGFITVVTFGGRGDDVRGGAVPVFLAAKWRVLSKGEKEEKNFKF